MVGVNRLDVSIGKAAERHPVFGPSALGSGHSHLQVFFYKLNGARCAGAGAAGNQQVGTHRIVRPEPVIGRDGRFGALLAFALVTFLHLLVGDEDAADRHIANVVPLAEPAQRWAAVGGALRRKHRAQFQRRAVEHDLIHAVGDEISSCGSFFRA
jgi:hypothetical protein